MDLIGSFAILVNNQAPTLRALTMIDPASGWFEVVQVTNKLATIIQDLFHKSWLACCPRPQFIVSDNGGNFKRVFKQMCENYGSKAQPTSSHNPQANTVIERVHKVVNDMFKSFDLEIHEWKMIILMIISYNQLYGQ
jgi:hypothetical protein